MTAPGAPAKLVSIGSRATHVAALVALATVYVVAARFGLALDAVAGFATLVWPATGIALAALVVFGYRLWPAIFAGAVVANVLVGAPALVALGIGVGNTLEAVAGAYLLQRIPGFRPTLDRVRDAVGLIGLAAILSTAISATIGVGSLYAGGIVSAADAGRAWRAWWLGDLIGDLVVAPALLVLLSTRPARSWPRNVSEAVTLAAAVLIVGAVVFVEPGAQAYFVFPPLIWASLRFEQRGAVTATLLTSAIAVWGTTAGHGPFARPVLSESLFTLQTFMAVTSATFLILGASIAERRRAEASLRQAHEKVAEANRVKGEFLAVMSHELRTPLNAVSGYVELLTMEVPDPITDRQRNYLDRIQSNARHLLAMIDDVLSFAKVEAGRLELKVKAVALDEVLRDLDGAVEPELRRRGLTLAIDSSESIVVLADADRLHQVLLNLVGNSMKFTPSGGSIHVATAPEGGVVRVTVSDTGIGIPAAQLERVFEPFFQVDYGTTRAHPGIGLGLAIARDLARAMGGDLRLASEPGRGTTAILELRRQTSS